jgi:hypothetical protein
MSADPVESAGLGIIGLIWLAFMISVARNLHRLRKEAEKQTALLERIVPPKPKGPERPPVTYEGWQKTMSGH